MKTKYQCVHCHKRSDLNVFTSWATVGTYKADPAERWIETCDHCGKGTTLLLTLSK
jgi:hypothetical protein